MMAELEPMRHFQASSTDGAGVRSGGPYAWRTPAEYFTFPMDGTGVEAFKTELGSVSIPTMEAIENMMPAKDWENLTEALNDDWALHDLLHGAQSPPNRMYPTVLTSRYGKWAGLPQFVRSAQLANYEAFRAMYEGRFAYMFQPCTGVLTWMSNCSQPSMVWQLYSYDLEPNSSLFATRKACESVHIQLNQDDYGISVINHTPAALNNLKAWVRIVNLDGAVAYDRQFPLRAPATSATYVGTFTWPDASKLSPVVFVKLVLLDSAGKALSDNLYWQSLPPHITDFTSLQTLPQVKLDATISRHDADGKCLLDVTLHNPAKVVALMSHVQLRRQSSNDRVLPVYYTDNYISLLPNESKTFTIEAASADLHGQNPLLVVDGWNTTIDTKSFTTGGPSAIAPNTAAIVMTTPTAAQP
jgi:beta-mannosidase